MLEKNINFSEEWLTKEIIKTHSKEREENNKCYIRVRKIDLLNLFLKFIKLNKRGE